jgi:hypothetical protein
MVERGDGEMGGAGTVAAGTVAAVAVAAAATTDRGLIGREPVLSRCARS